MCDLCEIKKELRELRSAAPRLDVGAGEGADVGDVVAEDSAAGVEEEDGEGFAVEAVEELPEEGGGVGGGF